MTHLSFLIAAAVAGFVPAWTALSDDQKAAVDAAAVKACTAYVTTAYPDRAKSVVAIGHVATFGVDAPMYVYYGVVVERRAEGGADRWMCLYDRGKRSVFAAGMIDEGP